MLSCYLSGTMLGHAGSVEQAQALATSHMRRRRGRSSAALSTALRDELTASKARTAGCWPERGRPDPQRQNCMLGGQLALEVMTTELPRGGAACTCSCASALGWEGGKGGGGGSLVDVELVALGYGNGSVDILFNCQPGAALTRVHRIDVAVNRLST